jgi:prepilin-type processing-associated H-X9-DG protein
MIRFACECGKQLQAREEYAGRITRCPDCGRELPIPEAAEAEGAAPLEERITPATPGPVPGPRSDHAEPEWEDLDTGSGRTSGKAIASLILGIASFLCTIFTGIPAIILGILGMRDVGRSGGRVKGQGIAIAGIVTGGVGTLLACAMIPISVGLLLPAVQKVREAANRVACLNNLRQITLALHNYHDTYGRFPPAVVRDRNGKALYSWRVALLPFLEEQALYKEFHLDEPWDSDHNRRLLDRMPKVYADPAEPSASMTVYQVFTGPQTAFEDPKGQNLSSFTDGPNNTLLVVEAAQPVRWMEPVDLPFNPNGWLLPVLANRHGPGFNAAFADGSVRLIQKDIGEETLRALITRNGKERVQLPPP